MNSDYLKFLEKKRHSSQKHGIKPVFMPQGLFDFQQYVAEYAIEKGRSAIFLDTGMGKTIVELTIAENYVRHTNKPVLILTPLAVAFQFEQEAQKFGISDVEHTRNGKFSGKIILCNYERLHLLNPDDFSCVICDESSILKDEEGVTRANVTNFLKKIPYRFLATATPSPNDFIELGTSSEALGYMGYMDMLTKFFKNNEDTISPQSIGVKWRLKGHAQKAFFEWVSSWSISARRPSDLGFSDEKHILPGLFVKDHIVTNDAPLVVNGQYQMFNIVARTMPEIKAEGKATVEKRCEKAAEVSEPNDFSVFWCNLDAEANTMERIVSGAVQISGKMNIEKKEEILMAFSRGEIKKLVTKPRITSFGLNWQHCAHAVFFPNFSYEQYYQGVRRFWRFGQKRDVNIDRVISDGQVRQIQALEEKAKKADELFEKLNANLNRKYQTETRKFDNQISLPSFI